MIKAVIFDMNGVIIVDEQYHTESWKIFCKNHNVDLTDNEFTTEVIGKRDSDTLNYIFKKELSKNESDLYSDERDEIVKMLIKDKLDLPDGLIVLLDKLQSNQIPLAVATSSRKGYVNFVMNTFGLGKYFPIIVTAEDVKNGKPDPEMYVKVAQELDVDPNECLVIEDSISGIKAAKSADMTVVAITSTHSKEELQGLSDYVIESFDDFDFSLLEIS